MFARSSAASSMTKRINLMMQTCSPRRLRSQELLVASVRYLRLSRRFRACARAHTNRVSEHASRTRTVFESPLEGDESCRAGGASVSSMWHRQKYQTRLARQVGQPHVLRVELRRLHSLLPGGLSRHSAKIGVSSNPRCRARSAAPRVASTQSGIDPSCAASVAAQCRRRGTPAAQTRPRRGAGERL